MQAIPAQCADPQVCFDATTAQRLLVDVMYCKEFTSDTTKRLAVCNEDRRLADGQISNLNLKVRGLTLDKETYRIEADKFQALYVVADTKRVKADNSAPSRLRWFATGVAAAVVTGIAAAIAFK